MAATRDEISGDEEGSTGTTARRNYAWSLQVRELIDFSRYVEPNSNPVGVATQSGPDRFPLESYRRLAFMMIDQERAGAANEGPSTLYVRPDIEGI